jgi:hypothetical protein
VTFDLNLNARSLPQPTPPALSPARSGHGGLGEPGGGTDSASGRLRF